MKKYSVLAILVCLLFLVGCVSGNYFKVPTDDKADSTVDEESELIKEIQEIEKQLEEVDTVEEKIVEEETEDIVDEEIIEEEITDEEIIEEETEEAVDTSALDRLEVQETDLVNLEIDVEDLDADTVTYTFSKPLDENGRWQTDYSDAGEYVITITANDGVVTSSKNILLVVKKKNVAPEISGLQSEVKIEEGDVITLNPKVTDKNKDALTISFSEPFNELGVWETDHTSAGTYNVLVTASDGELETQFTIKLIVSDVNVPPEISGLEDKMVVNEGDVVEISPEVSDLDGDKVTVTISEPVGDDGVWETTFTDHGEYTVVVTADDGKDKVTFEIDLTVKDVNVPPEIIGIRLG